MNEAPRRPAPRVTLLIVEDDEAIRRTVADALRLDGYTVCETGSVAGGRDELERGVPDLVLLDVGLPDGSGLELLADLRGAGHMSPVLVLTARGGEEDRVRGFEHGCDDYVVKPFSLEELRLRIRALLRRSVAGAVNGARTTPAEPGRLRVGAAEIDLTGYRVRRQGIEHGLSPKERDMLALFLARPGQVISREQFLAEVWGYESYPATRTVDMHVRKLREKIEADPESPTHLITVHGAGYRLDL